MRLIQFVLSLIFIIQMYVVMLLMAIAYLPYVLMREAGAYAAIMHYCKYVRFSAGILVGLRSEIRGKVPTGDVIVASKHQSFFDIIMIVSVCPKPKFVMKKQLMLAPIVGWFAKRIGCIPVDRGKRGAAVQQMLADAVKGKERGGQLIIYPQGTRTAPSSNLKYKAGTGALYRELEIPCVPAATNVGVFWPRHGIMRKRGLAVVEFLDAVEPGVEQTQFMQTLETAIEAKSDALMLEAGFDAAAARKEID